MAKKKLDQYSGLLSPRQVADGMNAANRNAVRLVEDAESLIKRHRFPSGAAMAILSIEESGKISILRAMALARNQAEVKDEWTNYRRHTEKNRMWILTELVARGARHLEDFRTLFDKESDHPFVLDQVKQIAIYTDCLGKAHWSEPENVIDEDLATSLAKTARHLVSKREFTPREIELWVKHMRPVWKGNLNAMKAALTRWAEEMSISGMDEFVFPLLKNKN
jgi:AbiV family abortive infection protein